MNDVPGSKTLAALETTRESLSGWGGIGPSPCDLARPANPASVADAIRAAGSNGLIARGCGRSYGDASTNRDGCVIDMTGLDAVESFDPSSRLIVCQAGVTLGALVDRFLPEGFLTPVCPGTGYVSVGGAVANDVHGKNQHKDGSFGDHVEWIELALPSGEQLRVSETERPDLFHATIGGAGLTGLMTRVAFRMASVRSNAFALHERRMSGLDEFMEALLATAGHTYSVGWIDSAARGRKLGRGILTTAEAAPEKLPVRKRFRITVPFNLPPGSLNRLTVGAFNAFYLNRVRGERRRNVEMRRFAFPLDALLKWNRLYGSRGFYQFQAVIPFERAATALRELLQVSTDSQAGSPLAVLKTMGREGRGMLSFPRPGFTLAMDFPRQRTTSQMIRRMHEVALANGGRVYLAKDAHLFPEEFRAMYPEWERFRALLREIDPNGVMQSDMARRIGLCE